MSTIVQDQVNQEGGSPITGKTERFETSQSNVAAFLVFCGHEIVESIWENETCTFFFEHTEELSEDFGAYCRGEASVEPVSFSTCYGQIMRLVKERRAEYKRTHGG